MKSYRSFSSIELGICIFLIFVIMASLVLLFNPNKRISDRRNDIRTEDINNILNAVSKYIEDEGDIPNDILNNNNCEEEINEICRYGAADCSNRVDLSMIVGDDRYLPDLPIDPKQKEINGTGYNIVKNDSGKIQVCAPKAELGVDISFSQ